MNKELQITHVIPALTIGGGERVAVEILNYMVTLRHKATLILAFPVDPAYLQYHLKPQVRVIFIAKYSDTKLKRYWLTIPWVICNKKWLLEQDILHCHLTYGSFFGLLTWLLKKIYIKKGPAIFETYHSVGMPMPDYMQWIHSRMALSRDAFVLMAEDSYWKQFIARHPKLKSTIIQIGASTNTFDVMEKISRQKYRKDIGIPVECEIIIGTIGRLAKERQPWLYVPIFKEVARLIGPKVHFLLAGDGGEIDRIRSLIREEGMEKQIHTPGIVINPALIFPILDIYVTINVGKITGIAAMEAALSGVPVVAIQALEDSDEYRNNWIWSSPNPIEIAKKITALILNLEEKNCLANFQKLYAEKNHTTEIMTKSYYKLYCEVLIN